MLDIGSFCGCSAPGSQESSQFGISLPIHLECNPGNQVCFNSFKNNAEKNSTD